jgi:hypothetical protein
VSASLLRVLLRAESQGARDAAFCRRWYRRTGMPASQVAYYGARANWPDACQLVRVNGAGPYADHLPH